MFVYNDIFFGPRFRRRILPQMNDESRFTLLCASFCGVELDLPETDRMNLIHEDYEE